MLRWSLLGALLIASSQAVAYDIIRDYSGSSFFDGWDFYGSWDNLTLGRFRIGYVSRFDGAHNPRQCYLGNPGSGVQPEPGVPEYR